MSDLDRIPATGERMAALSHKELRFAAPEASE